MVAGGDGRSVPGYLFVTRKVFGSRSYHISIRHGLRPILVADLPAQELLASPSSDEPTKARRGHSEMSCEAGKKKHNGQAETCNREGEHAQIPSAS